MVHELYPEKLLGCLSRQRFSHRANHLTMEISLELKEEIVGKAILTSILIVEVTFLAESPFRVQWKWREQNILCASQASFFSARINASIYAGSFTKGLGCVDM